MIHNLKLIMTFALVAVGAASCLEKYPKNAIQTEKAINTVDDVNQAVLGIYAGFKSTALYSGYMTLAPDIQADLVYAVKGYSNQYGSFWRWEILSDNKEIEAVYAELYTLIGRCNFVLDNLEKVRINTTDDEALNQLDELEGETYFARALAYSELIKLYCKSYEPETAAETPGVVLVSSYYNPEPAQRSSLQTSYEFVLSDLEKAADLIKAECEPNGTASDYFTTSVVNALYARVYLYMHKWEEAVKYASLVIDDPALELASSMTAATSSMSWYQYMWAYDQSPEVIWRVNFSLTSYGGALGRVFLNYNYSTFEPDYVPADWALNLYAKNDYRYATFFRTVQTGYPHQLTWPLLAKYTGNQNFINQRILHVNMPKVFRLSEQYLIRAEAYCNLKLFSKASSDITSLRSKRIASYGSANLSESNWLDELSNERVRELFMEGFRLHDLKRWHRGFERKEQLHTVEEGNKLKVEADEALFVWPIPQHELNSPGADIEPNDSNR